MSLRELEKRFPRLWLQARAQRDTSRTRASGGSVPAPLVSVVRPPLDEGKGAVRAQGSRRERGVAVAL